MQAVISKSAASLAGAIVPAKAGAARKSIRAPVVCAAQPVRRPNAPPRVSRVPLPFAEQGDLVRTFASPSE